MTLKNKIIGWTVATYLGTVIGCCIYGSYLTDNFNYSSKMNNGIVIEVENRKTRDKISPEKVTLTCGNSSLVGRDSNNDGSLDEIVLNIHSKDDCTVLLPLATSEFLNQAYTNIMESREYLETVERRKRLGDILLGYSLAFAMIGMLASNILKYTLATPEQLKHPLFHCR